MLRIALSSLTFDRGKLVASLAGVAFAATLVLAQIGLYAGFLESSSAVIRFVGGDVWVMAKGTQVVDNGERLSAGSREIAAAHPCVRRVRGFLLSFQVLRKPNGSLEAVQIVGYEPAARYVLPWAVARGLPQDLHALMRVAIDRLDTGKLAIDRDPLGAELGYRRTRRSRGGRDRRNPLFTLAPYTCLPSSNGSPAEPARCGPGDVLGARPGAARV
jgi:putative ABC transport system permease protein